VAVLNDINVIYRKFMISDGILDDEIAQIKNLLIDIATMGTKTFILWVQGVESAEMTNRERILTKLSGAGLIDLEFRYTEHNAYIRTKITEKGTKLIQKIRGN
jgi:hypothetical protein